jgi:hypothetical protein
MRRLLAGLSLVAAFALVAGVTAQEGKPVNAKCPVKTDQAAKADITTTYQGKTIGFC